MKRALLNVAVAALCVAGSAVAQDRSGQWLGNGARAAEDGDQTLGSGGYLGNGGYMGSSNAAGQMVGSGGFTMTTQDQWLGSGGRAEDGRQILGSGARTTDAGGLIG